ncbi:MAG: hypothetical protein DHS20C17_33200 [Cyclobacteriaceae bacterium]|nr:MAG: hypothetical protein DHS20C17_33200 [Cyclobacteriaceae bacterium]
MTQSHSITSELKLNHYPGRKVISTLLHLAYRNEMAVAVWKLPGDPKIHLAIDTGRQLNQGRIDLEDSRSGFLIAPFQNPGRTKEIYLKADVYYSSDDSELRVSNSVAQAASEHLLKQFKQALERDLGEPSLYNSQNPASNTSQLEYINMVQKALLALQNGIFQKVVPAALRKVNLGASFSCLNIFEKLCMSYTGAFVSLVSTPELGAWLGASPEALIEVNRDNIFSTVAVAGTQAYKEEIPLQEVAWRQKEIEEQALVSRYIINCFKQIRLREFEELGPKTVVAGNLLHLKTTYSVDMRDTNFPLLGSVMLDLLHPTSAVCGMPKVPSQEFLKENENFNRELFSGYLGPVGIESETHLFVNLRCMKIQSGEALLYAGAGVTEDSIPEKEWFETQLKCDTLLDVLNL